MIWNFNRENHANSKSLDCLQSKRCFFWVKIAKREGKNFIKNQLFLTDFHLKSHFLLIIKMYGKFVMLTCFSIYLGRFRNITCYASGSEWLIFFTKFSYKYFPHRSYAIINLIFGFSKSWLTCSGNFSESDKVQSKRCVLSK